MAVSGLQAEEQHVQRPCMEKPIGGYHIREMENENCQPLNKNYLVSIMCQVFGWKATLYGGSIESKEEKKNVNIKLLVISTLPTVS